MGLSPQQRLLNAWDEHQKGRIGHALAEYQAVLTANPRDAHAWCYAGIALHDQKRYLQAIDAYRRAIDIQPQFPVAWNNMGNSLRYVLDFSGAEGAFRTALQQRPQYANAFKNRAALRATRGNFEAACEDYQQAMAIQPNDPELHRNIGVIKLMLGEFNDGWLEYRWRWRCKEAFTIHTAVPKWDGGPITGKRMFLYAEQGLGDTINFIRYAKVLKDLGASKIFVQAQAPLAGLLRNVAGVDQWHDEFNPVTEPFDFHCSLIDCADFLKTDLTNIPGNTPYVYASKYLVDYWRDYLSKMSTKRLKVGLAWQGNRDHQADQFRSMKLSTLRPLLEQPNIDFYSFQQGYGSDQIRNEGFSNIVKVFPEGTDQSSGAFMDTAAIMSQLDLIITTDTSIAHLAGALGCSTWVMLNLMPDWRWLLHRSDSPWYPTMRLFRQRDAGDWTPVIAEIVEAVNHFQK